MKPQLIEKPVDKLIPYTRNTRLHSEEQVDQIAASIKEFGFLNPVIVDGDNGIVAGHGRVMAAKKLGMDTVPTIDASHLTDEQKRAFIIADNKIQENSTWSDDILKQEIDALKNTGFDLNLLGFGDELENFFDPYQQKEVLKEVEEKLRPKKMQHILISVPIDDALQLQPHIDAISKMNSVEIEYGAN